MNSYSDIAAYWDALTGADAVEWADYLEARFGGRVKTVAELACGTGSVAIELARRGYDVTAVDVSAEMLSRAMAKAGEMENRPLFLCQDIRELDLYGTYDAAVCCLDSLNYMPSLAELERVFSRVKYFVEPDGLFIFDVNTETKHLRQDGRAFADEQDGVFCVWQADYDPPTRTCVYYIDLFIEKNGLYTRHSEEHIEHLFTPEEITAALQNNGFTSIKIHGSLTAAPPTPDEERIFFEARRSH